MRSEIVYVHRYEYQPLIIKKIRKQRYKISKIQSINTEYKKLPKHFKGQRVDILA